MSKLSRQTFKQFGASGPSSDFCQLGSVVGSGGVFTQNIATLQANSAWGQGWQSAVYPGNHAPFLEEMNGLLYVFSYMLTYLFQAGTPEWDAATTYFKGSAVMDAAGLGQRFISLQDNNLNNAVPVAASNSFWSWDNPPLPIVPGFGNSIKANMVLSWVSTTKVQVNADVVSIQGVTLPNNVVVAVSQQANISVNGAGGLDTGAVAASTWYAVHLITNAAGTQVAAMFSLSATAPTMPGGYTLFRRVGWAKTNNVSAILSFRQTGDWTVWTDAIGFAFATPTGSAVSFASAVPPTSLLWKVSVDYAGSPSTVTWRPHGDAVAVYKVARSQNPNNINVPNASVQDLPLSSLQQADVASGSGFTMTAVGYYDPV